MEDLSMQKRSAVPMSVSLVLAAWGMLLVGPLQAQELRDPAALEAAAAQAERLRQQGRSREALPIAQRVVEAAAQLHGPDALETASYTNRLAILHFELGQYAQAQPLYQRSLQIREAQLGKDHSAV